MKYSKEERLKIGREIFEGTYTAARAAVEYGVSFYTARDYLRLFKASRDQLLPQAEALSQRSFKYGFADGSRLSSLPFQELVKELALAKIDLARANKNHMEQATGKKRRDSAVLRGEFEIIDELSQEFRAEFLCALMGIRKAQYYGWKEESGLSEES